MVISPSLILDELARTFNCGIGMILITSKENAPTLLFQLNQQGEKTYELGTVVANPLKEVVILNMEKAWM